MSMTHQISPFEALSPRRSFPFSRILDFPVLFAGVVAVFVIILSARPMGDQDIGWHLRNAEYFVQTSHFVRQDMFASTTLGAPWIDHEWLAELPFYAAWRVLGDRGLYLIMLLALEAIFLGVYRLSYQYSKDARAACIVTVAASLLGTVSFGPRTLLFGWLLLIIELLVIQTYREKRVTPVRRQTRILWLLPGIFLLWVNTHGSWLIGFFVFFTFIVSGLITVQREALQCTAWSSKERIHLTLVLIGCFAALFVNPYGWHLVAYPFDLAFQQKLNIGNVSEWQSLDFGTLRGRILFLFLGASALAQLVRRRIWSPYELVLLGIGLYAAMCYTRFLFLAAILVMPLLAVDLSGYRRSPRTQLRPALNAFIWIFLLVIASRAYAQSVRMIEQHTQNVYPIDAVAYLARHLPVGLLLNSYDWGGYLEWHARSVPVFIDSRVDIFERSGVLADYLDVVQLKNSFGILDKYKVKYVLFEPDAPLVYLLKQSSSWKTDYEDGTAILMERKSQ